LGLALTSSTLFSVSGAGAASFSSSPDARIESRFPRVSFLSSSEARRMLQERRRRPRRVGDRGQAKDDGVDDALAETEEVGRRRARRDEEEDGARNRARVVVVVVIVLVSGGRRWSR